MVTKMDLSNMIFCHHLSTIDHYQYDEFDLKT